MDNAPREERLRLFLEAVSRQLDRQIEQTVETATAPDSEFSWTQRPEEVRRLAAAIRVAGVEHEFVEFVRERLRVFGHDLFAVVDGATWPAEIFRVFLVDEDGVVLARDDLHDEFFGHLLDTGRMT